MVVVASCALCAMYLLDHSCPFVSIRGLSAVFSLFQLPTRHEPTSDQQGDCSCEIRSTGEPWRAKNPTDPHAGAVRVRGRGVGGRAGGILLLSGTECGLWLSGAFRGTLLPGLHRVPRCGRLCGCRGD